MHLSGPSPLHSLHVKWQVKQPTDVAAVATVPVPFVVATGLYCPGKHFIVQVDVAESNAVPLKQETHWKSFGPLQAAHVL